MKTLIAIIEDAQGNVIGADTTDGPVMLPEAATFPRAGLATRARDLATSFGVQIPAPIEAILPDPA